MRVKTVSTAIVLLSATLLFLAGCGGSKSSRFYQLTSIPPGEAGDLSGGPTEGPFVKIGAVRFPDYLMRGEIVLHKSANELELSTYDRWAEPLDENFTRVLLENLAVQIPTDRIIVGPGSTGIQFDCRLIMEVIRFDLEADSTASLVARWAVFRPGEAAEAEAGVSRFSRQITGDEFAARAAALSALIAELSAEIAEVIREITGA